MEASQGRRQWKLPRGEVNTALTHEGKNELDFQSSQIRGKAV